MKTGNILFILIIAIIIGMTIGSTVEKYFEDEPYFVFPMDTITIYKDTLFVDVFTYKQENIWADTTYTWEWLGLTFDGNKLGSDSITVSTSYYLRFY